MRTFGVIGFWGFWGAVGMGSPEAHALLVTEVFTNVTGALNTVGVCATKAQSTSNQFVEIYNDTAGTLDLSGYTITDGTGTDAIVPWSNTTNGTITGINVLNEGTMLLPAGQYALILDPDYAACDQLMNIHMPKSIYAFTIALAGQPLGGTQQLGAGGLAVTESVTIKDGGAATVATFGSTFAPSDPGANKSWERISLGAGDVVGNWQASSAFGTMSMGFQNSTSATNLVLTEVFQATIAGNNTGCGGATHSSSDQFVEVYNNGSIPLDLNGFLVGDGTADDNIVAWKTSYHGSLTGTSILMNNGSAVLPAGTYGLVLDPDYAVCDQSFSSSITGNVYLFSLGYSGALPGTESFGSGAISSTETVYLKDPAANVLSTYGLPQTLNQLPFYAGAGFSIERKTIAATDAVGNWQNSSDYLGMSPGRANTIGDNDLIITEVMSVVPSNPNVCCETGTLTRPKTSEFVEIYNRGTKTIDLARFSITEGSGLDILEPWTTAHGTLRNPGVVTNSTLLQPGQYGVVIDPDYVNFGDQGYDFPPGALIVTIGAGDGTQSIGSSGLSGGEPLTMYEGSGVLVTTYGSPVSSHKATYTTAIENGDGFPLSPGAGRTYERIDLTVGDIPTNWQVSTDFSWHSPGGPNSVVAGSPALIWSDIGSTREVKGAGSSAVVGAFLLASDFAVHQLGLASAQSLDASGAVFTLKLYLDPAGSSDQLSGSATLVGAFDTCPSVPLVRNAGASDTSLKIGFRDWAPLLEGRETLVSSSAAGPLTVTPVGGALSLNEGLFRLPGVLGASFLVSNQAKVRCRDGAWLISGAALANGMYKVVLEQTVTPSVATEFDLLAPHRWTRNKANQSTPATSISPQSIRISP